ncbi:hypothetical protein OAQ99_05105 [Candidatus Kapabacteria bacterium]|nr:hypothetical protein [Candidatus Kapabacteria bacterium]
MLKYILLVEIFISCNFFQSIKTNNYIEVYSESWGNTGSSKFSTKDFLNKKNEIEVYTQINNSAYYEYLKKKIDEFIRVNKKLDEKIKIRTTILLKDDTNKAYDTLGFYNFQKMEINGNVYKFNKEIFEDIRIYLPKYHNDVIYMFKYDGNDAD